jgi:hypothetical protein
MAVFTVSAEEEWHWLLLAELDRHVAEKQHLLTFFLMVLQGRKIWHATGLRQGNALSPMLFIIVMDALDLLFSKAKEDGILSPLSGAHVVPQRMLVYADDGILFLNSEPSNAKATKLFFEIFGCASVLR